MKSLLLILFIFPFASIGQRVIEPHYGGNIGIVANVGSHNTSLGVQLNAYTAINHAQLNFSSTLQFYVFGKGERTNFSEMRNAFGLVLSAGKQKDYIDFEFNALNHQSLDKYAVAYNYIIYTDNAGSSQHSGAFGIHLNKISIYHENDVFAGQAKDRYRTAIARVSYTQEFFKYSIGMNLWTGETKNAIWVKDASKTCPNGYRRLEELPFGKTSHGILYGEVMANGPYYQNVKMRLGVDSELIRNAVQNRLIHDLVFLPKSVVRKTPHYPMLDDYGCAVTDKDNRRKAKIYLQLGLNDYWSN